MLDSEAKDKKETAKREIEYCITRMRVHTGHMSRERDVS